MAAPSGIAARDRPDLPSRVALAALAILVVVVNLAPITNNDFFLHLKTGELIVRTGRVPRVDDYSALAAGRPYVAHEWLSAVLFHLLYAAFGFNALIVLKAAVALATTALLYAAARRLGAAPAIALPALSLAMLLAAARIMERPHIFSYLLIAATLLLLAIRREGARWPLYALPALSILWANLHGSFLLGPAIVASWAAGQVISAVLAGRDAAARRAGMREAARLFACALLMPAAALVNPYGWRLLLFPFDLVGSGFMSRIYEWLPPFRSGFAFTYMCRYYLVWIVFGAAVVSVAAAAAALRRERSPLLPATALLYVLFLALSLRMNRYVTDFALATCPSLSALASGLFPRRRGAPGRGLLLALAPFLIGLTIWFAAYGYPYAPGSRRPVGFGVGEQIPVKAADYLEAEGIGGNVFNSYAIGAYLVFRLYPIVRVAMDSRNDVYGDAIYLDYARALQDGDALRAMLERLDASALVLEWAGPGLAPSGRALARAGDWTPVYFDDRIVIAVRGTGPWEALARRDGYALLNPLRYRPGNLRPTEAGAALAEAERALRRTPSWIARVMRIDALLTLGREAEAFDEEAVILKEAPPLAHIYEDLGLLRLGLGDDQKAAARFRWALELNPGSPIATDGLRRAGASP